MEIVRVFLERDLGEGRRRIEPVAGMKFRERGPQHPILEGGKDLVADPLVERHPAAARRFLIDHARAENGIGFLCNERRDQLRQFFRSVLAVAVNEGNDVEPVIDRVAVPEFLVSAVALVHRRPQNGDLKSGISLLITEPVPEGVVLGRIVYD